MYNTQEENGVQTGAQTPRDMALQLISEVSGAFIGREEEARLGVLALAVKGHACFIGEPGTAKSALFQRLTDAVSGRYYYYLMSKYTIPDEIVGPIDPIEYRNGKFVRMLSGRIPEANVAFIDELFKASSETLNTLLNIMNERKFVDMDGRIINVPLISMFGASNEMPQSDELNAFFDRMLIKHYVKPVSPESIEKGILANLNGLPPVKKLSLQDIEILNSSIKAHLMQNKEGIAKTVGSIVTVMRSHGIFISDRTAMNPNYLPMLVAAHSYIFNAKIKRSAIEMSKYILSNNEEALTSYSKALDSLYPPELRTAQDKLEKAAESATAGNLKDARNFGIEAINQVQEAAKKESVVELYSEEIADLFNQASEMVKKVEDLQKDLQSLKIRK